MDVKETHRFLLLSLLSERIMFGGHRRGGRCGSWFWLFVYVGWLRFVLVAQASWVDPDTPVRYGGTRALTKGDTRDYQLVSKLSRWHGS